ncbi:hypothetical protein V6N13_013348 [Hibiscus sabdariffa]|uniref:HTH myb-type domain-containing protein n=2 Tax=Hibiscus sabdariffa TaxID=183260 RepID=A0ABR1ZJE4_9ROSI
MLVCLFLPPGSNANFVHTYFTSVFKVKEFDDGDDFPGLQRCGKSCWLRWTNYLRPDRKHGQLSADAEEQTIVKTSFCCWQRSLIAAQLPGQTYNDVKNHWNTKLKKFSGMGIDPMIHKPFSHLMAEIASTLAPPQVAHLAEAALGCFKDEMLQLKKKRIDFQFQQSNPTQGNNTTVPCVSGKEDEEDDRVERIKLNLYRAIQEPDMPPRNKPWESTSIRATSANFEAAVFSLHL